MCLASVCPSHHLPLQPQERINSKRKWTWWTFDRLVKSVRDLQMSQGAMGRDVGQPIRDNPTVAMMSRNLQQVIAEERRR